MTDAAPLDTPLETVALAKLRSRRRPDGEPSSVVLASQGAEWIADQLLFLYRWFEADGIMLEDDLEAWTGGSPYRVKDLLADLDRIITLLGYRRICE